MSTGLPLLLVCLAALETALFTKALWLFLAGTVLGGVAVGFIFRGGLSELNRLAEPRHRAAVISTFFVAAYLGLGVPAVLTGLISLAVGPVGTSSTLLGSGEGGFEPVEGDGLAAQRTGAEDDGEHNLQLAQDLVQAHPGAGAFGSVRIMVQKAWARTARVTWRCQPVNERPSKWSRPRPVFSSR